MKIRRTSACAQSSLAMIALVSTAIAQPSTWVVDVANGPGTDFTDLPTAVAAAVTGDTLVVRPGTYIGFETDQGLTILGEPQGFLNVRILIAPGATHTVRVHDLLAATAFRMAACEVDRPLSSGFFGDVPSAISIEDCAGSVLLDDVTSDDFPGDGGGGVFLSEAAQVQLNGCDFYGRPALLDQGGSNCTVVDTLLRGGNATLGLGQSLLFGSRAGLQTETFDGPSLVRLVRTSVSGGNGVTSYFGIPTFHSGSPAIRLGGDLIVAGDPTSQITAGANNVPLAGIGVSQFLAAGSVVLDPTVPVLGSSAGPAVDPALTLTSQHVPWVAASGGGPGGAIDYTLVTTTNNPVAMLLGLPALPLLTPFGDFELLAILPLFAGLQPAPGVLTQGFAVPNDPALSGRPFAIQAGVFDNASSVLTLTNSAQFLLYD